MFSNMREPEHLKGRLRMHQVRLRLSLALKHRHAYLHGIASLLFLPGCTCFRLFPAMIAILAVYLNRPCIHNAS